jgi:hypothetical protein
MTKIWIAGVCVILLAVVALWIAHERPARHLQNVTPTTTEKETARPVASDPEEVMALGQIAIQKTARSWMTAVLNGQLDKLFTQAETPFCLFNETVDTDGALQTKLDALMKSPGLVMINKLYRSGGLPITKVEVLEGEGASFTAGRSFKSLDTTELKLVRVRLSGEVEGELRRGTFDFVVVVKPGEQLRVVGFGED